MTYDEFRDLVAGMRNAQREYFRTRDRRDLDYARNLERQVDAALRPLGPQLSLFDLDPSA